MASSTWFTEDIAAEAVMSAFKEPAAEEPLVKAATFEKNQSKTRGNTAWSRDFPFNWT